MKTWITDTNGNRCSIEKWGSKGAARAALATLRNCSGCSDCSRCSDCSAAIIAGLVDWKYKDEP